MLGTASQSIAKYIGGRAGGPGGQGGKALMPTSKQRGQSPFTFTRLFTIKRKADRLIANHSKIHMKTTANFKWMC